jgi:hypothetical protein
MAAIVRWFKGAPKLALAEQLQQLYQCHRLSIKQVNQFWENISKGFLAFTAATDKDYTEDNYGYATIVNNNVTILVTSITGILESQGNNNDEDLYNVFADMEVYACLALIYCIDYAPAYISHESRSSMIVSRDWLVFLLAPLLSRANHYLNGRWIPIDKWKLTPSFPPWRDVFGKDGGFQGTLTIIPYYSLVFHY